MFSFQNYSAETEKRKQKKVEKMQEMESGETKLYYSCLGWPISVL
jgi:hypothetical protein